VKLDLVGLNKSAVSMSALEDCIRNTISHRGWLEDPNPNLQNYYFKERKAAPAIMKEKKFFSFRFLDTGVINDYSIEIKASTLDDLEQFMRTFSANLQKYLTVVLRHPEDFDPRKIFMVERKIYSSGESAVIHLGPGDICSGKDFLTQKQVANYIQSTLKANGWNQEKPQKGDFNQYFKVTGG
jgi:hypothetical protein